MRSRDHRGLSGVLVALACAMAFAGAPAVADTLAIVHGRAWTLSTDTPIDDATIVIADGRIVSVTPRGAVPPGARVLDAAGHPVTPALMHPATQLGLVEVSMASDTNDASVSSGTAGASFDVRYAINPNSELIALARADGLARAVVQPGSTSVAPWSGSGALLRLTEPQAKIEQPAIGVFASVGLASLKAAGGSRAAQWQLLRASLDGARTALQAPAGKTPRAPEVAALEPVLARRIPLVIAANRESDLRQAIALGTDYGIRIVIEGGAEAWRVAPALATAEIPVILDPQANLPASFDLIGSRLDNATLLHAAGVTIAFSVVGNGVLWSYDAGSSLREGAGLAVANGLPWVAGLRAITQHPARIWGLQARSGEIAPGMDADLVVWDGDPLEPSTQPLEVIVAGQTASRRTRQQELRDRYLLRPTTGAAR